MADRDGNLAVWHLLPGPALPDAVASGGGEWDYGPGATAARWHGIDSPARKRGRNVRDGASLSRYVKRKQAR